MSADRAIDRLDEDSRHQLKNLIAAWQMESVPGCLRVGR